MNQEPTAATPASPALQRIRALAVGSLAALIVLGLAWEMVLAPLTPSRLLALKVLPLCVGLAGLLRYRMYTYRWLALLVWLYFVEGVVRLWSDPVAGRVLPALEIALSLLLFVACTLHVRTRLPRKTST
jgi:uncharacterized membrane protein